MHDLKKISEKAKGILSENERWQQWVTVSRALEQIEVWFITIVQMLGNLDCTLILEDKNFSALQSTQKATIEESMGLTDRYAQSYLWVLGLYELVRTLDERLKKEPAVVDASFSKKITLLKHKIARLRMPLAKLEPSSKHKTDSPIAYPAMHNTLGISWHVAANTFISRRELSDEALALFSAIKEEIRIHNIKL